MSHTPRIELRGAAFGYGGAAVISGVDLTVTEGDFIGVLGRNGSGKTTLLRGLLGLLEPMAGRARHAGARMGYVPQRETLDVVFPVSVEEVVQMGALGRLDRLRRLGGDERHVIEGALERVGLLHRRGELFSSLSGGQRQRALIARALVVRPDVLVLDEPTSGVDTPTAERILELLTGLNQEDGLAIVIVSHQLAMTRTVRPSRPVDRRRRGAERECRGDARTRAPRGVLRPAHPGGELVDVGWGTIWELFHFAILSALCAGIVCPLVGAFLLVRRTGFYGVALPQFAATGVAFGWALPVWGASLGWSSIDLELIALESPHAVKNYLLLMAGLFTFGGLFVLLLVDAKKETETGRVAAAFALASAVTILLAAVSPHGAEVIEQLLRGEILTADLHEFDTIAVAYGLVLVMLVLARRDLLLVSFDRELGRILEKRVRGIEGLFLTLTGITVSVGVLIVGPVVVFGLLVLPPLAAHGLARSMRGYLWLSSALGVLAALGGVLLSFRLDWPLGPSLVVVAAAELPLTWLAARLRAGGYAGAPAGSRSG